MLQHSFLRLLPGLALLASYFALALFVIVLTGTYAWDDGAITLAFARTLGTEGVFALTGASEVVEGASTLLYTFLMAIVFAATDLSFEHQILAGQLMTLFWLAITLLVLNHLLKPHISEAGIRLFILGLFAFLPMHLSEIQNGMEMTLFACVLLLFAWAYQTRSAYVFILVPLVLLVRFEAVAYLAGATLAHSVFNRTGRGFALSVFNFVLITFALITLGRWLYFGDVVPNTIWAKMNAPYSFDLPLMDTLSLKSKGLLEFLQVNAAFIGVGVVGLALLGPAQVFSDIRTWLFGAFGALAFITGKNWGYDGRMFLAVLPLALWWAVEAGERIQRRYLSAASVGICALFLGILTNGELTRLQISTAKLGAVHQGIWTPADPYVAAQLKRWKGVTPANFKETGDIVDALGRELGLEQIVYMSPDMGGLGLCCASNRLKILDTALLTNRSLAREGYGAIGRVLALEKPDIIQTHGVWAQLNGFYDLDIFLKQYVPLVYQNTMLWVRADHVGVIKHRATYGRTISAFAKVRYIDALSRAHVLDREFLTAYGPERVMWFGAPAKQLLHSY